MKIALSGPQCTGKTTLLNQIAEKYGNELDIKIEVVRSIKKRWEEEGREFKFNKYGDFDSQMAIFEEHHRNVLFNNNHVVTDRCSWDAFTYATYNYLKGDFTYDQWKQFERAFEDTIGEYDEIIYLPPGLIEMQSDGVRDIDTNFQHEIGKLFKEIASTYDVSYYSSNDLSKRLEGFGIIFEEHKRREGYE